MKVYKTITTLLFSQLTDIEQLYLLDINSSHYIVTEGSVSYNGYDYWFTEIEGVTYIKKGLMI